MVKLPANLVLGSFGTVQVDEAGCFDGVGSGAKCVRSHVADGGGLTGGPGRSHRGRSVHLAHPNATCEPLADPLGRVQGPPHVGAGPGDQRPRSVIIGSFGLEQIKDPLRAVGRPGGDEAAVSLAQRLGRPGRHP